MLALVLAMSVLMVPPLDARPWHTLGPQVCDFIEAHLTFGPGDLLGQLAVVDDETRGLIYRMYEVHPRCHRVRGRGVQRARGGGWCHAEEWRNPKTGHPCQAGRRRFDRCALSLRKGSAKTEKGAWIAICELHPEAPVRTVAWDAEGNPIGGGVIDPYIPMVAYIKDQSEELAYGAMRVILQQDECDLTGDFDIGLARIMRADGNGVAVPLATAPKSRDGARTTFQHFDETHHLVLPRLRQAHQAMLANIPKRYLADAWSLETTTAPAPGDQSVAEDTMAFAEAVAEGRVTEARLFFFHRQASEGHDLNTVKGIRAAVREASGPLASWSNLEGIVSQFKNPKADRAYLRRVWLNQLVKKSQGAFDVERFKKLARPGHVVPDGALITLGFDGSKFRDATGLVATEIETGYQWVVAVWERPEGAAAEGWEVPEAEVNEAVEAAFRRWHVWRFYADPPHWETAVDNWAGLHGEITAGSDEEGGVVKWRTNQWKLMAAACLAYHNAILGGEVTHDGSDAFVRHVGNAHRMVLQMRSEDGSPSWVIQKERKDSPRTMDLAVCGVLSWLARGHALARGVGRAPAWDGSISVLA